MGLVLLSTLDFEDIAVICAAVPLYCIGILLYIVAEMLTQTKASPREPRRAGRRFFSRCSSLEAWVLEQQSDNYPPAPARRCAK